MPITVLEPTHGVIGPGLTVDVQTDFIGPLPTTAFWLLEVIRQGGEGSLWGTQKLTNLKQTHTTIGLPVGEPESRLLPTDAAPAGTNVNLVVRLMQDVLTELEQTSVPLTWQPESGMWWVVQANAQSAIAGGFTDGDRQQLADTRAAVTTTVQTASGVVSVDLGSAFRWVSQDFWSDRALSGGVTCDRVDYDASLNALYGVRLEIVSVPDEIPPRTPDQEWRFQDLAVLTFRRGGVILQRHGIHVLSHTVAPLPGSLWFGAFGVNAPIQPTDYHITVDWAPGVCGQLIGSVLPI